MKLKEIRLKSEADLRELLKTTSARLAELRFYHARSRSKNVKETRELKKQHARILTLLREKFS